MGADGGDQALFLFGQLSSSLHLKRLKVFQATAEILLTLLNSGFDRRGHRLSLSQQAVAFLIIRMLATPRFIITGVPLAIVVTVSRMPIAFIQSLAERLTFLTSTSILPASDGWTRFKKIAGRKSSLADPQVAMRYWLP